MSIMNITADQFDDILCEHECVLVDFWAPWCEPCQQMDKILQKVADEMQGLTIVRVNIDDAKSLVDEFQIQSVPRLLIIRSKVILCDEVGLIPHSALIDLLKRVMALTEQDIEQLRSSAGE